MGSTVARAALLLPLWVGVLAATRPLHAQQRGASSGSAVPCAVPMSWGIGAIDDRFGLTPQDALAAAREAAAMWEAAVGRELFRFTDDGSGSPVIFEYDERQAAVEGRARRRSELDDARRSVEVRRAEIEAASERLDSAQVAYEREAWEHRRALEAYNAAVASWNERGGAPPEIREELEDRLAAIERQGDALRRRQAQVGELADRVRSDVRSFNAAIESLREEEARFARDYPLVATESGRYDERVTRQDGRILSVERRIRVFQYSGRHDLALVLAHELGHALGLGHADRSGAVMSEVMTSLDGASPTSVVTDVDVAMLQARCPGQAFL